MTFTATLVDYSNVGNPVYELRSAYATGKCLDVVNGGQGPWLQLWACNYAPQQRFILDPVSDPGPPGLPPEAGGPGSGGGVGTEPTGGSGSGGGGGGGGSSTNEHSADITNDGIADLLRYHENGHLYFYPGRGSVEPGVALWSARDLGPDWAGTVSITAGDLNRNGIADLLRY